MEEPEIDLSRNESILEIPKIAIEIYDKQVEAEIVQEHKCPLSKINSLMKYRQQKVGFWSGKFGSHSQ